MGPTASGKTGVALELAKRFPVEIVSVDSALVYRDMDIGTAKPDAGTLAAVPHHLIDIIDPTESYSAAQFRDAALRLMGEITARGRVPLLTGGTMLYFKALREGLSDLPAADAETRKRIDAMALDGGWQSVHRELAEVDPATAARLNPNDSQRIQRALEIFFLTGTPMSEHIATDNRADKRADAPCRMLALALVPGDRAVLHQRIADRFENMLELGLLREVRELRAKYDLDPSLPSVRCVGYRQAWQHLDGEYSLSELREKAVAATRQLAKRQLTWLRAMPDVSAFDCLAADLQQQVENWVERQLET
jgi:tRNA dimethylallyltransferase